ncbi:hypothetical protein FLM48_04860 [Shewanella sp. Scap07]|uniref:Rap1a/Tai family immunity protein n=1 Tax=Shewanella sp. Scap07 TaxID=2589987 RepID=UPI0015BCABC1|nr:Rap1a/Tai family immunity protein [Shewanella sp. Scap07]QLE84478.1 hypothetical protein FLM48_04860 [Shewanella sp. Scap07]
MLINLLYLPVIAVLLMQTACAANLVVPKSDTQRMISQNLDMSTKSFMEVYMGANLEQRRLAEMYLVGVIDSTEGRIWCGYGAASPSAIQEQAYIGLKNTLNAKPDERASKAIVSRLKELLPCKEDK